MSEFPKDFLLETFQSLNNNTIGLTPQSCKNLSITNVGDESFWNDGPRFTTAKTQNEAV